MLPVEVAHDDGGGWFCCSRKQSNATPNAPVLPWPRVETGDICRNLKGEDMWCCMRATLGGDEVMLALVADGHGGKDAASYCKQHVLNDVVKRAQHDGSTEAIGRACTKAFLDAHAQVRKIEGTTAGCTLTVCAFNETRGEITTCNVGDSMALLVPTGRGGKAFYLSLIHI